MMQIYLDAIHGSMTGFPQYVMQKGLQLERTKKKEYVIDCLKNGWEMKGAYIDGIGYEVYKTDTPEKLKILKKFIANELSLFCPKFSKLNASDEAITIYFQEYYKSVDASRELHTDICFSVTRLNTGMEEARWIYLNHALSSKLEEFLMFNLQLKQDNSYWIEKLQKELDKEVQSLESEEQDYD